MRGVPFAAALDCARADNPPGQALPGMTFRFELADPDTDTPEAPVPVRSDGSADRGEAASGDRAPVATPDNARRDLDMVEDLLDRCWREIDIATLNVKLADIVRLLEFKSKLRSATDAQQAFWSIINGMRREELDRFGDVNAAPTADSTQDSDDLQI